MTTMTLSPIRQNIKSNDADVDGDTKLTSNKRTLQLFRLLFYSFSKAADVSSFYFPLIFAFISLYLICTPITLHLLGLTALMWSHTHVHVRTHKHTHMLICYLGLLLGLVFGAAAYSP